MSILLRGFVEDRKSSKSRAEVLEVINRNLTTLVPLKPSLLDDPSLHLGESVLNRRKEEDGRWKVGKENGDEHGLKAIISLTREAQPSLHKNMKMTLNLSKNGGMIRRNDISRASESDGIGGQVGKIGGDVKVLRLGSFGLKLIQLGSQLANPSISLIVAKVVEIVESKGDDEAEPTPHKTVRDHIVSNTNALLNDHDDDTGRHLREDGPSSSDGQSSVRMKGPLQNAGRDRVNGLESSISREASQQEVQRLFFHLVKVKLAVAQLMTQGLQRQRLQESCKIN